MKTIAFDAGAGASPKSGSIRQNAGRNVTGMLPDWRNLGVLLRVLLGVNLLAGLAAALHARSLAEWVARFVENAVWVEIPLLATLLLLAALRNLLWRPHYRIGLVLTLALAALCGLVFWEFLNFQGFAEHNPVGGLRAAILAIVAAGMLLFYFNLRARALARHVEAARLAALNARIRPHFLFNSLNTVLALIRDEPRRAETALEELADLFRALMRDPSDLVSLSDEIALCRQYLELEKLRLGDRLQIRWEVRDVPLEILMPPLILQPLLENAVQYGIAPPASGGEVHISIRMKGEMLNLTIENPLPATSTDGKHGNQMALSNIRARLALFYDMEASLEHGPQGALYHVKIELPCRFKTPS